MRIGYSLSLALFISLNSISGAFAKEAFMIKSLSFADTKEINLQPASRNVIKVNVTDIVPEATHVKVFINDQGKANLKLLKNKRLRKIKKSKSDPDQREFKLKLVTGELSGSHHVNLVFYQKIKGKKRKKFLSADSVNINIIGGSECLLAEFNPVCGIKYTDQNCPFENARICLFNFDSELRTYNSLCELGADGAEFLHEGECHY